MIEYDWIELDAFVVHCILGILDREQREPQPLEIEARLGLSLEAAGERDDLAASIDYAAVMEQLTTIAVEGRWRLLESMALAMARCLLAPPLPSERRAQVERVELALRKPAVLGGRAVPGIRLCRDRSWLVLPSRELGPGVRVDVLQENAHNGAYRIHLAAGATFELPDQVAIQVIAGELEVAGRRIARGGRVARGASRRVSSGGAVVLALAVPPM